MYKTLVQAATN